MKTSGPAAGKKVSSEGLRIPRRFTRPGVSVFDQFTYEKRAAVIRNPHGEVIFELKDVEVPTGWSQVATDILAQKYFRRTGVPQADGSAGGETSIRQVVHRLAACWVEWGKRYGYFHAEADAHAFYEEVVYMLLAQMAAPNSPQWFNTGLYAIYGITGQAQGHYFVDPDSGELRQSGSAYERPQPHACFILSVKDDLVNPGGIMDLWVREARIFKYGSGVGTNYSSIRGEHERLSGGGYSSGLMSFLKIGDRAAGAIKSGGTTRRAAKMVCLDIDHPEIESFIQWKAKEERKVAALIAAGYPSDFEGEAYATVSGQNSNNSVRIPDAFFNALMHNQEWELRARTDGSIIRKLSARTLWEEIGDAAWQCADPGLQFDTTINDWHTCPKGGRIRASNPCSEYMFLDDTACNLASLNLIRFYDESNSRFDVDAYLHACRLWTIVLEISVLMAQYPSEEVARNSYDYRTLGLGYANLGSLLMVAGMAYDSPEARAFAASLTAIMTGAAYAASAEMAKVLGPFSRFTENREAMLRVIRNHRYAAYHANNAYEGLSVKPEGIDAGKCPDYLLKAACSVWDVALKEGELHGFRNAQVTVIAPTGTIGLVMDCDTTGVEPDFALVKFKKLAGGGYFRIVNQSVAKALKALGYTEPQVRDIEQYVKGHGTLQGAPFINHETLYAKGLTKADIQKIDDAASTAFDVRYVVTAWYLTDDTLGRLGISPALRLDPEFSLLKHLGFTEEQIEEANAFVCGTMTVEGAPHLREEHLPVFDCANPCGKTGERFIHPSGHIRMMAAVQPFISGAISKTINLPHEATRKDILDAYHLGWEKGLKAVAVYRDGSKLAQPLSSRIKKKQAETIDTINSPVNVIEQTTADQVLEAAHRIIQSSTDTVFKRQLSNIVQRKRLPSRRNGFTQRAKVGGETIFIRTGENDDGTLGEIFIDMPKEGASFRSLLNCFAIAVSIGLQYGVPLEELTEKFIFTRFEPSGSVDHPNIKSASSVIDYIFRMLSMEYLGRTDLVEVPPAAAVATPASVSWDLGSARPSEFAVELAGQQAQKYLAGLMGDAPVCHNCGHITILSGSCYKCLNCGTSLGCS